MCGIKLSGFNIIIVSEKNGVICYIFNDKKMYEGVFISFSMLKKVVFVYGGIVEYFFGSFW